MRLIDRYIIRQIGESYVLGVGAFTSILLLTHLFYLARLSSDVPVPLVSSLALLVLRVPYYSNFSLPFATLFAVLMAFGRLSEGNEITAMRTSGWSLGRVAAPVVITGAAVMLFSLTMGEWVVPQTEARYRALVHEIVRRPPPQVQQRVLFREPIDGVDSVFYAQELNSRDGTLTRVAIIQFQDGRPVRVIEAETARHRPPGWVLVRGRISQPGSGVTTDFEELRVALARSPRQLLVALRDPYEMSIAELRRELARLRAIGEGAVRYAVALQAKLSLPASSVIFALLAVPLGLRPHRSGRSIGFGLTVAVLLAYYVLMSVSLTLGERGQLPALLAAWFPNLVVATIGGYLLWRST